ncbi:MAG: hypothetical protein AB7P03_05705 [Kofleriaceae bacterium]
MTRLRIRWGELVAIAASISVAGCTLVFDGPGSDPVRDARTDWPEPCGREGTFTELFPDPPGEPQLAALFSACQGDPAQCLALGQALLPRWDNTPGARVTHCTLHVDASGAVVLATYVAPVDLPRCSLDASVPPPPPDALLPLPDAAS